MPEPVELGGECGRVRLVPLGERTWDLRSADGDVLGLARELTDAVPSGGEVLVRDPVVDDPRLSLLMAAGFETRAEKLLVRRSLRDAPSSDPGSLTCRSLDDLGEETFAQAMYRASIGDAFSETTAESALADLRELIDDAGESFDPTRWFVVEDMQGEVGVVLPQRYDDEPHRGTLFYIGVTPGRRGQGWGRRLHSLGLALLAESGVTDYVGSTDTRNRAMRAVFTANGCATGQRQLFLRRP